MEGTSDDYGYPHRCSVFYRHDVDGGELLFKFTSGLARNGWSQRRAKDSHGAYRGQSIEPCKKKRCWLMGSQGGLVG